MKTTYLTTLLLSLASGDLASPPPSAPERRLVIVGGGGTDEGMTTKVLELAGGAQAKVLIVPQASERPEAGGESASMWRERGAKNVDVLDLSDEIKALAAVQAADVIWMSGGDQNRLMDALRKARLIDAIRERCRHGAVVGGTSAGAAAMSPVMLTGGGGLDRVAGQSTETAEGLGLWPGTIVDQHFIKRQRFNRLLSAVLDRPDLVGVGIDEATAVIVSGARFEVIGQGQVLVIDARRADRAPTAKDEPAAALHVTLHIIRAGMKFDLESTHQNR